MMMMSIEMLVDKTDADGIDAVLGLGLKYYHHHNSCLIS
jgi:hypothetical protein